MLRRPMSTPTHFREQADMCRRWAKLVMNGRLRLRLFELALHLDSEADKVEDRHKLRTRNDG